MKGFFQLTINGERHRIEGDSVNGTLLAYLREKGLTGAKEACSEGACGACTVVVIDRDAKGEPVYRSINSCLTLLPMLADRHLITVEGLNASRPLHPVQEALREHFGSQCGYCTPGAVMALFDGYYRSDLRDAEPVEEQFTGNLCRCTGYGPVRAAAAASCVSEGRAETGDDPFVTALREISPEMPPCEYVDANDGRFYRPFTITELLRMRHQYPDARLVAGGTKAGLEVTKEFKRHRCVISLEGIPELKTIVRHNGYWEIGSMVTLTQFQEGLEGEYPAIDGMVKRMGSRQIRNRSTVGGNLVPGSPSGDLAPVLIALEAAVRVASPDGEREVPVDQFVTGPGRTALRANEILKDLRLPRYVRAQILTRGIAARLCQAYKVSKRRHGDEAIVVSCFAVELDGAGEIKRARLAYGGVAPVPARARKTEDYLVGKAWTEETVMGALAVLQGEFEPPEDELASADYRAALVTGLFEKFYREFASGEETPVPLGAAREFRKALAGAASAPVENENINADAG